MRDFFRARDFVEVATPVRLPAPALEDYIDAIPAHGAWLRTSPELHLKRLLAGGLARVFQIGPCFRLGEHGRRHRPEFTMLEWYWVGVDYQDLLRQTEALLAHAAQAWLGSTQLTTASGQTMDLSAPAERLTVAEAFARYAQADLSDLLRRGEGAWEEALVTQVEPQLGRERPTFLLDYPIELAALARAKPGAPHLAERWELYLDGLELANCYSELTDATEQRRRFAATADLRRRDGREVYPLDEAFLAALESGMPACSGCALGVDRLLMALSAASDIAEILPFPEG